MISVTSTRHAQRYVDQWQRLVVDPKFDFSKNTSDGGATYRLSRCVLLAHEDKVFQGALVASMSIPWGETKGDQDLGSYHLVWTRDLVHSQPTGTAMPLCWSHAEYVSLVRSRHDGVCFDRVDAAYQRYVNAPIKSRHEIWTLRHPLRHMPYGKTLRIILADEATIVWSANDWGQTNESQTTQVSDLNLWFADLSTAELSSGSNIVFTWRSKRDEGWDGRNWHIGVD
jgi:hypothetical protein